MRSALHEDEEWRVNKMKGRAPSCLSPSDILGRIAEMMPQDTVVMPEVYQML